MVWIIIIKYISPKGDEMQGKVFKTFKKGIKQFERDSDPWIIGGGKPVTHSGTINILDLLTSVFCTKSKSLVANYKESTYLGLLPMPFSKK